MSIILVVNSGSSSLKFQMFQMPAEKVIVSGQIEKIGLSESFFSMSHNEKKTERKLKIKDHKIAVNYLLETLSGEGIIDDINDIIGVGHRVTHGGELYSESVIIDEEVVYNIDQLKKLAPIHNPVQLLGIKAFMEEMSNSVHVAVFDTAFHQTMEPSDYLYPIPYELYEKHRIRKYGFHGTSHYYISRKVAQLMQKNVKDINVISVHLGGGASITAVEKGRSVNNSMGFTPLAGIMMGTRSGDIDPAIFPFLMEEEGLSPKEVLNILNNESGMFGVSGISSDARDIIAAADKDNKRARLALEIYSNRIAEVIGSYFIKLKKVDAIVFTGGIGENASTIRKDIFDRISCPLNLQIDSDLNSKTIGATAKISLKESSSQVWIIPTDEEVVIARDTFNFIS